MKTSAKMMSVVAAGMLALGAFGAGDALAQARELVDGTDRMVSLAHVPTPLKYELFAHPELESVSEQLALQGLDVLGVEREGRRIEVTGVTATGHCLEVRFNAQTGKEIRRKRDNDCFED